MTGQPEVFVQLLQPLPAQIREAESENLLARPVQEQNTAAQVRSQKSSAHGMNDVFGEILEVQKLFTFFFEFQALAAERMCEKTRQIRDR